MNTSKVLTEAQINIFDGLPVDLHPIIIKYAIITSDKPTNTAFALMCIGRQWCTISKDLFDRDPEVWASFVGQIEKAIPNIVSSHHKNIFFIIWMVNFLKAKTELSFDYNHEVAKTQLISKFESLPNSWNSNGCIKIIENIFESPSVSEITFSELLPLFNLAFSSSSDLGDMKNASWLYEILFYIVKNTTVVGSFILIKRIATEIDKCARYFSHKSIVQGTRCAYKLSRLIERLGNYVINENTSKALKTAYLNLIVQFFCAVYWIDKKPESYLEGEHFLNIAIKFFQLLPHEEAAMPLCIFDLIFDLKKFEKKYEVVADIIDDIKQLDYFRLDNIFRIENQYVRNYFLMDILSRPNVLVSFEHLSRFLIYLDQNRNLFLDDVENYLKLIETMFVTIQNNSEEDKTKALDWIEFFFNSVKFGSEKDSDPKVHGYLEYFKSI